MPPQDTPQSSEQSASRPGVPSPKAQSWGAAISIVVIICMIIIGAFYAWGQRVAQDQYNTRTAPSAAE